MKTFTVIIKPDGKMRFVYDDSLRSLIDKAKPESLKIQRASDVEANAEGKWVPDMQRVGGPIGPDFRLRAEAIAWEVEWLNERLPTLTIHTEAKRN